jgi:hypothetical protein
MSDKTELAMPVPPRAAADNSQTLSAAPALHRLGARDLAQLLLGFHFLFWGLLVLLAALTESLVTTTLRPFAVFFIGASSLGMSSGAWRLHRVNALGQAWHHRTRDLLIATSLAAYLSLYYIMWRQVPKTLYFLGHAFLGHAIAFGAVIIALLCLLCLPVGALARAAGRRNLSIQCVAFGTVAVVLLFPAFGQVAVKMVESASQGIDPFDMLRDLIANNPFKLMMVGLLPFSLTLSLLWSAKDLVWERLHEIEDGPPPPAA